MLLLLTMACLLVPAQQRDSVTHADSTKKARLITPVVVSATREETRRNNVSANVEVLNGDDVRLTRASHPSALMNRIAGVHITELSAEGHSTAIRQPMTTKPVYLYLEDGVPTRSTGFFNHNALYEVNIPQSGGIEVLKGPGTALYGSDAIGGVINVLSRPAPQRPTVELSLEGGAHGYHRILATGGTTVGKNSFRADLNLTGREGWRNGSEYTRRSSTLRWDVLGVLGMSAKTVVTASSIDQHDVPTLNAALFNARSAVNTAPIAFRQVRALRYSTELTREQGTSLWSVIPYARHNVLNLLPYWQLSFDKQIWNTSNNSYGLVTKYRRDIVPGVFRVITGIDVDLSPGKSLVQQITSTKTGSDSVHQTYAVNNTSYDYDVTYKSISPYIHSEYRFRRLGLDAGIRYDASRYSYTTHLAPVDTGAHKIPASTDVSYRHLSPKLGATLEILPELNLFASYRHGFRAPSQSQLFQQGRAINTVGLKPIKANSYEVGIRGDWNGRAVYQVSAYNMRVDDDVLTYIAPLGTRETVNAGRTLHRGIEMSIGFLITQSLKADIGYTFARHTYVHWTTRDTIIYSGNLMEQAPQDFGNVMLAYSPDLLNGGRIAAEWSRTGRYATDPGNTNYYAGHNIVNLHFNAIIAGNSEVFLRLINAGNKNYSEITSFELGQAQYSPGNPRSLFAGVRYSITGDRR